MFARVVWIAVVAVVLVGVVVHASEGARRPRSYVVRPGDTLWSIAAARYPGDPRKEVWRIERRNHVSAGELAVGQRLVLP